MISALSWIPTGAANLATPEQGEPAEDSVSNESDPESLPAIEKAHRFAAALKATAAGPAGRSPEGTYTVVWLPVHSGSAQNSAMSSYCSSTSVSEAPLRL